MKTKLIILALITCLFSTSMAYADAQSIGVTPAGVAFPTGIDFANTPNWDPAVANVHETTGIQSGCELTRNAGDNTKVDIGSPCIYHIGGPEYTLTNMTAISAGFDEGTNSRFFGVTMTGYTSQELKWTAAQQGTVVPIGRLNTILGDFGPGSPVHLIRDDIYPVARRDQRDRIWMEEVFGSQYSRGGEIFANATSNLVLGQYSGIAFNAQKERHVLAEFSNMTAIFAHHSSNGIDLVAEKRGLIVDNTYYDDGTGKVELTSQQWTNISIAKSVKGANGVQEGGWFYFYGDQYATELGANAAPFDLGGFQTQAISGISPLATIVIKKGATVLGTDYFIYDKRPCQICR